MSAKKMLVALGVTTVMLTNGLVMAAVNDNQPASGQRRSQLTEGKFRQGQHAGWQELAKFLKLDNQEFKTALQSGKSLLNIAKDQGISEKALTKFLTKQQETRINEGLKAERISKEQAQTMRSGIKERVEQMINRTGMPHHNKAFAHRQGGQLQLAEFLGIDQEQLQTELRAGKSLLAVADEQGKSAAELKQFLVEQMAARITADVEAGRIPAEREQAMRESVEQRAERMVNQAGQFGHKRPQGFHNQELLTLLDIDRETLRTELQAGKSLVAIAAERGVSESELKQALVAAHEQRLEQAVAAGKLTPDKAEQIKADFAAKLDNWLQGKQPLHRR